MRSSWPLCVALLVVLGPFGCKGDEKCEAHCGPCGGEDPLPRDTLSPVRYGSDSQGVPVIELLFEEHGSCPGESSKWWMLWKGGAPSIGDASGNLDTKTADLVYVTDLHSRAIAWNDLELLIPYYQTWDAFSFSVIEAGEDMGTFQCAAANQTIACEPLPP